MGQKVRADRLARGLSLTRLSARTGISISHLSKIETAKITPTIPALATIAGALGRPLTFFFQTEAEIPRSLATVVSLMGPEGEAVTEFSRLVEGRSEGRMKLQILSSSGLDLLADVADTLLSGAVDMFVEGLAFYQGQADVILPASLPFCFRDPVHYEAFMGSELFRSKLVGALHNKGVRFLDEQWRWRRFPQVWMSRRPIFSVDDLRGLKMRIYHSGVIADFWEAFGARPVFVPWVEIRSALARDDIDCVLFSAGLLPTSHFAEVVKYVTFVDVCDAMGSTVNIAINEERYQLLPPEIQGVLSDTAGEIAHTVTETLARSATDGLAACIADHDLVVSRINLAPFRERAWEIMRHLEGRGAWPAGLFEAIHNL
jgi:TRAP-type C4-dicarboxylate transport system substrate-binding protein